MINVHQHIAAPVPDDRLGLISTEPPKGRVKKVRGRGDLLDVLERELANPSGRPLVFHGGGGFGKTTLALEAARLAAEDGTRVWWISASDTAQLTAGLREVALALGAGAEPVNQAWSGHASAPDLLWRYLHRSDHRWLLLIDDANEPQSLTCPGRRLSDATGWLRPPPRGRGTVVVTTRDGNRAAWGEFSRLLRVDALDDPAGGRVLVDLAGEDVGTAEEAQRLSEQLGGLPLALHIAGTYLAYSAHTPTIPGSAVPRSIACYGRALGRQFAATIDRLPPDDRRPRAESELVTRTWELSLDLLARQGHPKARSLLRFLACFSQASILYDLLDARAMRSIPAFDDLTPEELLELLHILADFGLVDSLYDKSLKSHALTLHPLVRETNLHHLDTTDDVEDYARALLGVLEAALDGVDPLEQENKSRWLAVALHGTAPAVLVQRTSAARGLLARSTFLEYLALLFLEYNQCWNYIRNQRCVTG